MTLFNNIQNIYPYLISIRKLDNILSIDIVFPEDWKFPSKYLDENKVHNNGKDKSGNILLSFISSFSNSEIQNNMESIESIIKFNREREKKDILFKNKVNELREIFTKNKLKKLETLEFKLNPKNNNGMIIDDNTSKTINDGVKFKENGEKIIDESQNTELV